MANPRTRKRLMAEINVVPYIDVMLVLLVIFMITAPLLTQGVKVDLPQAASEPIPPTDKEPLVVSVDAQGNYYLDYGEDKNNPIDAQTLVNRVTAVMRYQPGIPVLIKGAKEVSYGRVVQLMALLKSAGVPTLGLLTEPPREK
jgi:biopolymer transport protein TolR